jgi:capsular polysaccharide biosynthesis protein
MMLVRDIRDIGVQQRAGTPPFYDYRQVAPPAIVRQTPPPFLLGPATADILWDVFAAIETPAAGCYTLENVTIAPTGFAIKDSVALHGDAFLYPRHHVVAVSDRLNAADLPIRDIAGPLAIICGPAHETWGHWLTDFLPRLWVLRAAGHDLATLRFLMPPDLKPFAGTLLTLCGIEPLQCVVYDYWNEIVRTDLLLMPTGLRAENRFCQCFDEATSWWTQLAGSGLAKGDESRLFLSRAGSSPLRALANRSEIESMARDAGYAIVQPETLSIPQQIALFSGARIFVGEYGSALHNSVFAAPGAVACGLRGTSRHPSLLQSGIATALGQHAAYVFGDTTGQDVEQRFTIDPRLFAKAVELL